MESIYTLPLRTTIRWPGSAETLRPALLLSSQAGPIFISTPPARWQYLPTECSSILVPSIPTPWPGSVGIPKPAVSSTEADTEATVSLLRDRWRLLPTTDMCMLPPTAVIRLPGLKGSDAVRKIHFINKLEILNNKYFPDKILL